MITVLRFQNFIKDKVKEGYPCEMEVGKGRELPNKTGKREDPKGMEEEEEDGESRTIGEPKSERFGTTPKSTCRTCGTEEWGLSTKGFVFDGGGQESLARGGRFAKGNGGGAGYDGRRRC